MVKPLEGYFYTMYFAEENLFLSAGGYTYLWIYRVDEYLTDALPKVMNSSEQIKVGLYQVLYEDENIAGMQYVSDLN